MGQKLERVSEKDEESLDNSDWSEQTGDTRLSEVAEQDEVRDQEDGSSAFSRLSIGGIRGINIGKLAVISSHTDPQSGQPVSGQSQQEHLLNSRGERVVPGRGAVSRTVPEPKRILSFKEKRQTSNRKQGSEQEAAAWTCTAAMDELENQNFPETNHTKGSTTSCRPPNEEDFVVLERDEKWMLNEVESNTAGHQDKPRGEEDGSESCSDSKVSQPSRVTPRENNDVTHGKSSNRDTLETETGCHSAQLTSSRCQLKGANSVWAAKSKTTAECTTEADRNVAVRMREEQKKSKDQQLEAGQSPVNRFAGAVSKRAKAGVQSSLLSSSKTENSKTFDKVTGSRFSQSETSLSGEPHVQDNHLITLEQTNAMPSPSQARSCDEKGQVACLKKESELVCFSAVVTPPPLTHVLPGKDTTKMSSDNTSAPPGVSSASAEKSKPKGPPPPVPKKPKNPFIKLKTAQLMSTDVQRRAKDHLRSEDRAKRRHTFHFNKDLPYSAPTNQDMCILWDEKGTYAIPTNSRRLSADIGLWDHLSLRDMDDRFRDMIDYDYCVRMAELSPEEEPQNLDMMQRQVFLERRSRRKWSPPPFKEKPQHSLSKPGVTADEDAEGLKSAFIERKDGQPDGVLIQVNENNQSDHPKDFTDPIGSRDTERSSEVGSYKPVAEIVKETNQMQKQQSRVKSEVPKAQVRLAEQNPTVKVSQMKNTFDIPKKSKERPTEVQTAPKKGKKPCYSEPIKQTLPIENTHQT